MAKQIASLHAQIGASAAGFTAALDKIEAKAKGTERVVNGTKMTATVEAKTANLDRLEQRARALDRTRATVRVDANTAAAQAKLEGLRKLAQRPLMIGTAILMGAVMRALVSSEEGKRLQTQLDQSIVTVLAPLLRSLVPAVEALTPVTEQLGDSVRLLMPVLDTATHVLQQAQQQQIQTPAGGFSLMEGLTAALGAGIPPAPQAALISPALFPNPQATQQQVNAVFMGWLNAVFPATPEVGGFDVPTLAPAMQSLEQLTQSLTAQAQQMQAGGQAAATIAGAQQFLDQQLATLAEEAERRRRQVMLQFEPLLAEAEGLGGNVVEALLNQQAAALGKIDAGMAQIEESMEAEFQLQQDKVRSLEAQLSVMQRQERLMGEGAALMEGVRSPLEILEHELARIARLQQAGTITQDAATLRTAQAIGAAQAALPQETATPSPAVLERDSAVAASAILAAQRAQRGAQNPNQRVENLLEQLRELQANQLAEARRLVDAFEAAAPAEPRELR